MCQALLRYFANQISNGNCKMGVTVKPCSRVKMPITQKPGAVVLFLTFKHTKFIPTWCYCTFPLPHPRLCISSLALFHCGLKWDIICPLRSSLTIDMCYPFQVPFYLCSIASTLSEIILFIHLFISHKD